MNVDLDGLKEAAVDIDGFSNEREVTNQAWTGIDKEWMARVTDSTAEKEGSVDRSDVDEVECRERV